VGVLYGNGDQDGNGDGTFDIEPRPTTGEDETSNAGYVSSIHSSIGCLSTPNRLSLRGGESDP
jgi:hypothetical protein